MMSSLIIFGAGGHGKVILETARVAGWSVQGILDDRLMVKGLMGVPVSLPDGFDYTKAPITIAIGRNDIRKKIFLSLKGITQLAPVILHPFSGISPSASFGAGSVVLGGVVVNADSRVGQNCILNTSCSVDHDCIIGDHVHIGPGARLAGGVQIGTETLIGAGAVVLPGVKIGSRVVIGAGAVVNRNVPSDAVAYGVPAKTKHETKSD